VIDGITLVSLREESHKNFTDKVHAGTATRTLLFIKTRARLQGRAFFQFTTRCFHSAHISAWERKILTAFRCFCYINFVSPCKLIYVQFLKLSLTASGQVFVFVT
jgi:hypothetical protein